MGRWRTIVAALALGALRTRPGPLSVKIVASYPTPSSAPSGDKIASVHGLRLWFRLTSPAGSHSPRREHPRGDIGWSYPSERRQARNLLFSRPAMSDETETTREQLASRSGKQQGWLQLESRHPSCAKRSIKHSSALDRSSGCWGANKTDLGIGEFRRSGSLFFCLPAQGAAQMISNRLRR